MGTFSLDTAKMLVDFAIESYNEPEEMDLESLGFHLAKFINNKDSDTQALIAKNDNQVVLAFRGTSSVKDAITDLKISKTIFPNLGFFRRLFSLRSIFRTKAHAGFFDSYNSVRKDIHATFNYLKDEGNYEFYITGHSLGGALATIAGLDFTLNLDLDPIVYTFGAPKVGNKRFVKYYNKKVKNSFRVVNDNDPVPSVPGSSFKHVNNFALIDDGRSLKINPNFLERFERGMESIVSILTAKALDQHSSQNYKVLLDQISYP